MSDIKTPNLGVLVFCGAKLNKEAAKEAKQEFNALLSRIEELTKGLESTSEALVNLMNYCVDQDFIDLDNDGSDGVEEYIKTMDTATKLLKK